MYIYIYIYSIYIYIYGRGSFVHRPDGVTFFTPPPGSHNSHRMCLEIPFQSLPSPVRFGSGWCGPSRVGTRAFKKSYQRNCASRPGRQVASATPKRFLSRLAFVRPGSDPPASKSLFGDVSQPAPLRLVRTFRLGQFLEANVTTHFAAEVCIFSGAPQTVSSRDAAKSDFTLGQYCFLSGVSDLSA